MNHQFNKFNWIIGLAVVMSFSSCSNKATSFSLGEQNQQFGQVVTYNNKVDILFLIDNSKSMIQHQQRLAARVPDMVAALNQLKMDYQVGVTTTTMAQNSSYPMSRQMIGSPKFLTASNIGLLTDRLVAGDSGSDNERGLDAVRYITSTYAPAMAPGFIRPDALFVVIVLADENDKSSEFGNPDTDDFVNYMNNFKPNFPTGGRGWFLNYIGTIRNENCDNLGGFIEIGTRYMRLVDASNGIKESICVGDLSNAVSNIKARIVEMITAYPLKSMPDKKTIRVTIGGAPVAEDPVNGWTLETEIQNGVTKYFIKFHGRAVPAADQQITVDYTPATAS